MSALSFIGSLLAALGACATVLVVYDRLKLHGLARARRGEGLDDFVRYFAGQGVPEYVLREVFQYFQEWVRPRREGFPVRATDGILRVYGLADDDLDDAIHELARKCRRKLPARADFEGMPRDSEMTIEDLVGLLGRLPAEA